ncbi:FAD binding domain-containing protein [Natranaerofaba carboxydovora]|uniref:FAD binding domain-containing protein n=1 Tax=Natranaerofaba carboxydovora TaxID=2742683 RepID=UPI002402B718|nr:FAD binding domain-containing protein [Natranaerofaba carboxydovora]
MKKEYGENAKFLAGGTDLFVQMRDHKITPQYLIDLKNISELEKIEEEENAVRIGSRATITQLKDTKLIRDYFPSLSKAASCHGSEQVRNLATVGGNLCNAAPSNETSPPLITLDAELLLINEAGTKRTVLLKDFITGPSKTQIEQDEILHSIIVPKWTNGNVLTDYERYSTRNQMDIALASASVLLQLDENNEKILKANIALGGVAPTPMCLPEELEKELEGKTLTEDNIEKIANRAATSCNPSGRRTPVEYRRQIINVLVARILRGMQNKLLKV